MANSTFDDIADAFALLDDWEDRYRYLIELGSELKPMAPDLHTEHTRVQGCVSQVWLVIDWRDGRAYLTTDSDAHIVKGLLALVVALYDGRTAEEILATDAWTEFRRIDLEAHLTPQRSNGLRSVVETMRKSAQLQVIEA